MQQNQARNFINHSKKEVKMLYEYTCAKCNAKFEELMSVEQYETFEAKCPECGSKKVKRNFVKTPVRFNFMSVGKNYLK